MIPTTLPQWFAAFLGANLLLVFVATLYYAVRGFRWRPRRRTAPFVFRCSSCGHVYLDRRGVPMAECPKCGTMNEIVRPA